MLIVLATPFLIDDLTIPVPLATFVDYGLDFQRRFVPALDVRSVIGLRSRGDSFELRLEDGEVVGARRVILAVGIAHFDYMPPVLARLPAELATHSSAHHNLDRFKDRDVTVIGAGASAVDLSALLHEAGAKVRARCSHICNPVWFGTSTGWKKQVAKNTSPAIRPRLGFTIPIGQ